MSTVQLSTINTNWK